MLRQSLHHFVWILVVVLPLTSAIGAADDEAATATPPVAKPPELKEAGPDYFELFKLFADTIDQIERNYVKPVDRRELIEAAIRGLTTELDPYSNYIPPNEIERFRSSIDSEFGGIGIQVTVERGQLTIISPLVGTPAYRSGLMAGDDIIEIGSESTDGLSLDEAVHRMKGKVGTEVTLTVRHTDNEQQTVTLKREIIRIETVLGDLRNEEHEWDYMYSEGDKIGYIRLTAFGRHTARDLRRTIEDLKRQGLKGLVLDLRFNPGGLLSSAVEVCDMFISSGVIVSTQGRNTKKRIWKAHASDTLDGISIAILVNSFSASASEIVAACLQDHGRAVIIGERTWGKGSVQNVVELEDGRSALKLTTASYERPSGKEIHRFHGASRDDQWGVAPDEGFVVELDDKETRDYLDYRRERDVVLAKNLDSNQSTRPDDDPADPKRVKHALDSETLVDTDASVDTDDADTDENVNEPSTNEPKHVNDDDTASQGTEGDAKGVDSQPAPNESRPDDELPSDSDTPPHEPPDVAPAKHGPSKVRLIDDDFVDRQLDLALTHLRKSMGEVARK